MISFEIRVIQFMLSILIPTYNYNVFPLAENLVNRASNSDIAFELICIDDGSNSEINKLNEKINSLNNCKFIEQKTNSGRTASRHTLAKQAEYDWLLFLDADVMPKNDAFLTQYVSLISESYEAIFGGIAYNKKSYNPENVLRYTFGSKREVIDAKKRNDNPYRVTCSANFMIKKDVFLNINANLLQNAYGLDYVFGTELQSQQISILHINNEVYHLGVDNNVEFLNKTKRALQTLYTLNENDQINNSKISLLKAYFKLKSLGIASLFGRMLDKINNPIEKHLKTSKSPSLFVFDLYRLGYFCRIKSDS